MVYKTSSGAAGILAALRNGSQRQHRSCHVPRGWVLDFLQHLQAKLRPAESADEARRVSHPGADGIWKLGQRVLIQRPADFRMLLYAMGPSDHVDHAMYRMNGYSTFCSTSEQN